MGKLVLLWASSLLVLGMSHAAVAAGHCDNVALRAAVAAASAQLASSDIKAKMDNPKLSRILGDPQIEQCNGSHCTVFSVNVANDEQWKEYRNFEVKLVTAGCQFISVVDTSF